MRFKASFSDTIARRGRSFLSSLMDFSLFIMPCAFFPDAENLSIQLFLLDEYVRLKNGGFASVGAEVLMFSMRNEHRAATRLW